MKKYLILYISIFAALLAVSCAREVMPENRTGFADGETGLVMRVRSAAPGTRLLDPVPEKDLNEYRLEQFYYFIYKDKPSESGNTKKAPVYVGKWSAPLGEDGKPTIVTGTGTEENIPLDKLTDLKDNDTYSGYVYVIANYKSGTVDEEGKDVITSAWDDAISAASPDYSTFTWTYLQNLKLPATFDTYQIAPDSECMNDKADKPVYRFKPQDSFVMASAPTSFTVTKGKVEEIDAPLKRLAVKISLEMHLAKWYVQRNNGTYKATWYSKPERVQVYLNYAAKTGTIAGKPLTYVSTGDGANTGDFFTYRRFAFIPDRTKEGDAWVFPDGNYSDKEPLHWIRKADPADEQPEDGQFYTNDDDLVGKIVEVNGKIQYHEFTRPAYKITGTPFYSYPYDYSGDSGHAPFFKIIVEWDGVNEAGGTIATEDTPGEGGITEAFGKEFFYKITIPEVKVFQANQWMTIRLNLSTLGSEADEAAIDVSSDTYFVADWSSPTNPAKPDINAGRYLNVSSPNKAADGSLLFKMYGSTPLEIPVTSSHAIEVTNISSSYRNFYTGNDASLTRSTSSATGNNFMLVPSSDNSIVTLSHTFVTALASMQPRDVAKITYKFRIKHTGTAGNTYYQDITVEQFPSLYIEDFPNSGNNSNYGYAFVNASNGTNYGRAYYTSLNDYNHDWTYYLGSAPSGLENSDNTNVNMYVIHTMVLPSSGEMKDFYLGDTRSDEIDNLGSEWSYTATASLGGSRKLRYYYPVDKSAIAANTIAPAIRVASSYGATYRVTYDDAFRRCASYQEDGYPAGRWRLPTNAEVVFIAQLTANNLIPRLLGANTRYGTNGEYADYWSNNGYMRVYSGTADQWDGGKVPVPVASPEDYTATTRKSVRCVYDEWYWDDTVDRTTFTWGDKPRQ